MDKEKLTIANTVYDKICQYQQARNKIFDPKTYLSSGLYSSEVSEYLLNCIDTRLAELEKEFKQL